jgi:hypothetical protein
MAGTPLTTALRRKLYSFTRPLASLFSDSRRSRFVTDMLTGLIGAGHVHLTAIARALPGMDNLHATQKRLSRHLSSEHWDASPLADELLRRSAALVTDDTLLVADTTDLAKLYARKLEGLGKVHDGSDPNQRIVPGYGVFEAYVRVGKWQLFPLLLEPLKVYSGAPTSENVELLAHLLSIHEAVHKKGTWLLDSGFDRRTLYGPLVANGVAFVVRQRGDRNVRTGRGRGQTIDELVAGLACPRPRQWPKGGVVLTQEVWLPEVSNQAFLLVVSWRWPDSRRPLILLVSPAARRPCRTGRWYVRAYRRRWGVEDATRGIKQSFHLEAFLTRSWRALRRLLWLVGWAFWWLNLWGEEPFDELRERLLNHPWRLPKAVLYLFDWIARMLRLLLHPHPNLSHHTG